MKRCEMKNPLGGGIKGFSELVYRFLGVAAVVYALVIVMHILSEIWPVVGGEVAVVTIGGWRPFVLDVQLLHVGQSAIVIPVTTFGLALFGVNVTLSDSMAVNVVFVLLIALIAHGLFMVCLLYARALFGELKEGVSPFSPKMVQRVFWLALIATLLTLANLTLGGGILLIVMWLVYYVFDYGRKLQDESDQTL